jgi:hypothetical protein
MRIAHYSLVHGALYSKIRSYLCVFMRILEAWKGKDFCVCGQTVISIAGYLWVCKCSVYL